MPAVWVKVATAIRMRTSPFDANGLRTVRNVGGIITAIASRQWPTNIAAAGQGIGQPFEARRIDAVGLRLIGDFIGMTRPSIALQVSAFRSKAGMAFCEVRFRGRCRGQSGHAFFAAQCPLLTQSGHSGGARAIFADSQRAPPDFRVAFNRRRQSSHDAVLRHHSYRGVQRPRELPCAASVPD